MFGTEMMKKVAQYMDILWVTIKAELVYYASSFHNQIIIITPNKIRKYAKLHVCYYKILGTSYNSNIECERVICSHQV